MTYEELQIERSDLCAYLMATVENAISRLKDNEIREANLLLADGAKKIATFREYRDQCLKECDQRKRERTA